jgi:hypothetical protein
MILKEASRDSQSKDYTRPREDLSLGAAQLQGNTYGFYKGRYHWLHLQTKGLVNSHAMLEVLRQAYGPGYKSNPYIERFAWLGSRVSVIYEENSVTSDASVAFQSNPIVTEKEVDAKASCRNRSLRLPLGMKSPHARRLA